MMGQRLDVNEGQFRADCEAAGVQWEAVEILVKRAWYNLPFRVIAGQFDPPLKPSTARSLYTRATARLRHYHQQQRAEPELVGAADPEEVTTPRAPSDRDHAREILAAMRRRVTSPPTPTYDEQERQVGMRSPLVNVEDVLPFVRAGNVERTTLRGKWGTVPAEPGWKLDPFQGEKASPRSRS